MKGYIHRVDQTNNNTALILKSINCNKVLVKYHMNAYYCSNNTEIFDYILKFLIIQLYNPNDTKTLLLQILTKLSK